VNNAEILYGTWQQASNADLRVVYDAFETNTFGPWRMCQAFIPLMRDQRPARIVNVPSEARSLANMGGGTPTYSTSFGRRYLQMMDQPEASSAMVNHCRSNKGLKSKNGLGASPSASFPMVRIVKTGFVARGEFFAWNSSSYFLH
jgi:hypothetical protein